MGSIPGLGRSPGGGHGNPLQYSCLKNSTDRGAWWATVHGVEESLTRLKRQHAGTPGRVSIFSAIKILPKIFLWSPEAGGSRRPYQPSLFASRSWRDLSAHCGFGVLLVRVLAVSMLLRHTFNRGFLIAPRPSAGDDAHASKADLIGYTHTLTFRFF